MIFRQIHRPSWESPYWEIGKMFWRCFERQFCWQGTCGPHYFSAFRERMFCQSCSAKLQMPHWFQNLWIPQERNVVGIGGAPPLTLWKLTSLPHLLSVPGRSRCGSVLQIQVPG